MQTPPRYASTAASLMGMLLLTVTISATAAATSKSVQLRGSTTMLPIAQEAAESYMNSHPAVNIVIGGGGTARGYKAILDGTADVAMASGAVPEDIANSIEHKGIHLRTTTVSYDAIVPLVHPSNPVKNLSLQQLKNIFTGRIKNWKELGGKNAPIEVYVGPPTGGISDTWKKLILGEDDTYTPSRVVMGTESRMAQVASHPHAISYITKATLIHQQVKILTVNGVVADVSAANYPLRVPLMLVTTTTASPATKDFIAYFAGQHQALQSEKGDHE